MHGGATALLGALLAIPLSGCVAAAVPVVAGAAIAGSESQRYDQREASAFAPVAKAAPPLPPVSATGSASTSPAFSLLIDHVRRRARLWREGAPINSLVLDDRHTVLNPVAVGCERLPPVVIIDLDTANFELVKLPDLRLMATAGWSEALAELRRAEVGIVRVTDYPAAMRAEVTALLASTGLDTEGQDRLLTVDGGASRKQLLRRDVARDACVLAVAGDKRGDADEAYDYLRSADASLPIDSNWGEGWFLMPAPLMFNRAKDDEGSLP